jgi:hypothetical protein
MNLPLSEAPVRRRLALAATHLQGKDRDVLSAVQGLALANIDTPVDAIRTVVCQVLLALQRTLATPHERVAEGLLLQGLAVALAHPGCPPAHAFLKHVDRALANEIARNLEHHAPDWSASDLEWKLAMALVCGWPDVPVDVREPFGEWHLGSADPVFQALLAVTTLRAWGLLI